MQVRILRVCGEFGVLVALAGFRGMMPTLPLFAELFSLYSKLQKHMDCLLLLWFSSFVTRAAVRERPARRGSVDFADEFAQSDQILMLSFSRIEIAVVLQMSPLVAYLGIIIWQRLRKVHQRPPL